MRKFIVILLLLAAIGAALFWLFRKTRETVSEVLMDSSMGTAVVIPGAAARIPQEAALLEELDRTGQLKHVVFISGVSSGALNAVMLNAILSGKYTWERYRRLLFNLRNEDIFINYGQGLPVDTEPFRKLMTRILHDSLGYYRMADLPIPTSLSVVSLSAAAFGQNTFRLSNMNINRESDPSLDLLEVLMASTAFPIAFPPVTINRVTTIPESKYIDGGAASDYIPYRAVLDFEKYSAVNVDRMIVVCRKPDTEAGMREELRELGLDRVDHVEKFGISLEELGRSAFKKSLLALRNDAPLLADKTLLYIPDIIKDFPLFDFHSLEEQYLTTFEWAQTHRPVPYNEIVPTLNDLEK
jgi:predicted acylesterase/phospholipase RssA